jgi:membrane protein
MGVTERLDNFQRRHEWAGAPLAVLYKFHDDQGVYLAALIAFYGFLSLFPLLLLFTSILGFVLQNDAELQTRVLDSTLSQFPVIGQQLGDPQSVRGSGIALVVSVLVAVYGALGVAHAIQHAMNVTWAVPRCRRPNPFHLRLRSLVLIAIGGLATITATVLSGLASATAISANLDWLSATLIVVAAIAVNTVVFVVGFWICVPMNRSVRSLLPGAVTAAVVWQALQLGGTTYVSRVVTNNDDDTYGAFALVLGLIAWIFLAALAIVFSAEIDVVRFKRLYPRSLLTPFTDDVELTGADRRTYTDIATAQQYKEFETVTVSFTEARQGVADPGQQKTTDQTSHC